MVAQQPFSGYKQPAAPSSSQSTAAVKAAEHNDPIGDLAIFQPAQPEMNH
jgi:hypothetical protein